MNISIAFTLSVVIGIVFAAFNGLIYGILSFILIFPILVFLSWQPVPKRYTKDSKPIPPPKQAEPTLPREFFAWPELSKFEFEVTGEPHYQPALKQLAILANKKDGELVVFTAHLIPDDQNLDNSKAVQVNINNLHVGQLGRSDARSFRRRLSAKKLTGQTTTCQAVIIGGYFERGLMIDYGVNLDLKPFI